MNSKGHPFFHIKTLLIGFVLSNKSILKSSLMPIFGVYCCVKSVALVERLSRKIFPFKTLISLNIVSFMQISSMVVDRSCRPHLLRYFLLNESIYFLLIKCTGSGAWRQQSQVEWYGNNKKNPPVHLKSLSTRKTEREPVYSDLCPVWEGVFNSPKSYRPAMLCQSGLQVPVQFIAKPALACLFVLSQQWLEIFAFYLEYFRIVIIHD